MPALTYRISTVSKNQGRGVAKQLKGDWIRFSSELRQTYQKRSAVLICRVTGAHCCAQVP